LAKAVRPTPGGASKPDAAKPRTPGTNGRPKAVPASKREVSLGEKRINVLRKRRHDTIQGDTEALKKQHQKGKLSARERIEKLLDPGTFEEWGALAGFSRYGPDGALEDLAPTNNVMGTGRVEGRKVVVSGDDFTVRGGSADATIKGKHNQCEQMANELRLPLIRLVEGSGGGGSVKTIETTGRANVPGVSGWEWVVNSIGTVPRVALGLGSVAGLGADCVEKEMRAEHLDQLRSLLARGEIDGVDAADFRRYGSARRLYNFDVDNLGSY